MSIIPDDLKTQTFQCPSCGQIISSEYSVCKFCLTPIDETLRSESIRAELRDRSLQRLRNHKFYVFAGLAAFAFGMVTLLIPWAEARYGARMINFSCWTPLLLLGGVGAFSVGIAGYLREKRYLRDV